MNGSIVITDQSIFACSTHFSSSSCMFAWQLRCAVCHCIFHFSLHLHFTFSLSLV